LEVPVVSVDIGEIIIQRQPYIYYKDGLSKRNFKTHIYHENDETIKINYAYRNHWCGRSHW
jgi:hypothetical protein